MSKIPTLTSIANDVAHIGSRISAVEDKVGDHSTKLSGIITIGKTLAWSVGVLLAIVGLVLSFLSYQASSAREQVAKLAASLDEIPEMQIATLSDLTRRTVEMIGAFEESRREAQIAIEAASGQSTLQAWGTVSTDELQFSEFESEDELGATKARVEFPQPFPGSLPVTVLLLNVDVPTEAISVEVSQVDSIGFELRFTSEASIQSIFALQASDLKIEWAAIASILN